MDKIVDFGLGLMLLCMIFVVISSIGIAIPLIILAVKHSWEMLREGVKGG